MAISSCSILPRSAPYVDCIRLGCEPEGASLPAAGQGLRRGANPSLPSISVGCSLWRQRNGIEGTGKERKEKETSSSVHRPPAALAHPKHTIALPPLPPGCRLCPCLPFTALHGGMWSTFLRRLAANSWSVSRLSGMSLPELHFAEVLRVAVRQHQPTIVEQ